MNFLSSTTFFHTVHYKVYTTNIPNAHHLTVLVLYHHTLLRHLTRVEYFV
jgi:hypothetical protein